MKKSLFLTIVLLCIVSFAEADDVMKVAPNCCKVLLENDEVRVLDYVSKAGEKVGMHSHPAHVVYALTDGKIKFINEDGSTREVELKAGQAIYSPAVQHATETGASDVHVVIVEMKR